MCVGVMFGTFDVMELEEVADPRDWLDWMSIPGAIERPWFREGYYGIEDRALRNCKKFLQFTKVTQVIKTAY